MFSPQVVHGFGTCGGRSGATLHPSHVPNPPLRCDMRECCFFAGYLTNSMIYTDKKRGNENRMMQVIVLFSLQNENADPI